ncbi:YceH family protein [Geobacter sp. DSM 9736]|uniref:YceH family protein n=1 Tax=Geobacter sp. DSM 9736 TaxID=1277350 RepID=UPI000B50CD35|nr:YceH family protein [Geobacter sp. DSM 9736]SNB47365.1 hypothetical protein SAMN06269301_2846 [Geobacter sp. DSM 9736]
MYPVLNDIEVRILGCLIEKELTTPEYYPLTLNSLTTACNQKSNRDPVMNIEEGEVVAALDKLRFKGMARLSGVGGRVPKYCHSLAERLRLDEPELAVLAELLLRGPQTMGELRNRADRMSRFPDMGAIEAVLKELMDIDPPLVKLLPRQPGRKEQRYAHLLSGEPVVPLEEVDGRTAGAVGRGGESERMAKLEEEVSLLRNEVAELRRLVEEFKSQFE